MLELLARFIRGADPWVFVGKEHWSDVLGEKVETVIEQLRRGGALELAPPALRLAHRYSANDLRFLLEERGIETSGSRDDLIRRLLARDPSGARLLAKDINVLVLSAEGKKHVLRYVRAEKARREEAERRSHAALLQEDPMRAALTVAEFQRDSVFSRGVGVAFHDDDQTENVTILQNLYENTPALLNACEDAVLRQLRPAAGMAFLWNREDAAPWIPADIEITNVLGATVICDMLIAHARFLSEREHLRESLADTFEIQTLDDGQSCGACRELRGTQYTIDALPELPHAQCTSPRGCRCFVIVSQPGF